MKIWKLSFINYTYIAEQFKKWGGFGLGLDFHTLTYLLNPPHLHHFISSRVVIDVVDTEQERIQGLERKTKRLDFFDAGCQFEIFVNIDHFSIR